jgi:hypothetical protein
MLKACKSSPICEMKATNNAAANGFCSLPDGKPQHRKPDAQWGGKKQGQPDTITQIKHPNRGSSQQRFQPAIPPGKGEKDGVRQQGHFGWQSRQRPGDTLHAKR